MQIKVNVKLWNYADHGALQRGLITPSQVRQTETEGIVDTGAMRLVLPRRIVHELGLEILKDKVTVTYADKRKASRDVARGVAMEIMGREGVFSAVMEEDSEVLIGLIVLEDLDLHIDSANKKLIPNPESPDKPHYTIY
jgi:predicted aspartyl protease